MGKVTSRKPLFWTDEGESTGPAVSEKGQILWHVTSRLDLRTMNANGDGRRRKTMQRTKTNVAMKEMGSGGGANPPTAPRIETSLTQNVPRYQNSGR